MPAPLWDDETAARTSMAFNSVYVRRFSVGFRMELFANTISVGFFARGSDSGVPYCQSFQLTMAELGVQMVPIACKHKVDTFQQRA